MSLAGPIDALASRVPVGLIAPGRLAAIREIARWLPAGVSEMFGFECRLGAAADAQADFLLRASCDTGQLVLAGTHPFLDLPLTLTEQPIWQRVRALCRQWQRDRWPVDNVWLEFDVACPTEGIPVPSVFIGPWPSLRSVDDRAWLLDQALPTLFDRALPASIAANAAGCLAALPESASLFQIGAMLPRGDDTVRLCVAFDRRADIARYLTAAGWPGDGARLEQTIAALPAGVVSVAAGLDVGDRVSSRIGLECYAEAGSIRADWSPLLDDLVARGLCSGAKRDALRQWPGVQHEAGAAGYRVEEHRRAAAIIGDRLMSVLVRWLHHVKLTVEGDRVTDAKAYLAVHQGWRAPMTASPPPPA